MRLEGWELRLAALLSEARNRPFEWGAHDCMLFAADAVVALTGRDPAAEYRGAYDSALGASRIADPFGGYAGLIDHCLAGIGSRLGNMKFAQRGDIALIGTGNGPAAGVVIGSRVAAPVETGWALHPLNAALVVWAVR